MGNIMVNGTEMFMEETENKLVVEKEQTKQTSQVNVCMEATSNPFYLLCFCEPVSL